MSVPSEFDFSHLSAEQRLALVDALLESLGPDDLPISEAVAAELDRRVALLDSGQTELHAWEDVKQWLRNRPRP